MDAKKIIIIGAGGHGRVVAEIARLNGYCNIKFLDDDKNNALACGNTSDYINFLQDYSFFVAIGCNLVREKLQKQIEKDGGNIVTLIHPAAVLSSDVKIGKGVVVMAGVVVNTGAVIEDGCILNTCSSVDHDCKIGQFSHVSVGAHIAGTAEIGKRNFICAGATIINNLSICSDCVIGAGAVVVKNIKERGTYIGVPAELRKK